MGDQDKAAGAAALVRTYAFGELCAAIQAKYGQLPHAWRQYQDEDEDQDQNQDPATAAGAGAGAGAPRGGDNGARTPAPGPSATPSAAGQKAGDEPPVSHRKRILAAQQAAEERAEAEAASDPTSAAGVSMQLEALRRSMSSDFAQKMAHLHEGHQAELEQAHAETARAVAEVKAQAEASAAAQQEKADRNFIAMNQQLDDLKRQLEAAQAAAAATPLRWRRHRGSGGSESRR